MDGFLLAGGLGRRFGGPKAGAQLAGRSFAAWAVDALRAALGAEARVWFVAPPERVTAALRSELDGRVTWLADAPEGSGPLAGLLASVRRGGGLVLSVDMPCVPPAALRELVKRGTADVHPWALSVEGRIQPLTAYWPREAARACETALGEGGRVLAAFQAAGGRVVVWPEPDDLWRLRNVNTPADLAAFTAAWRERGLAQDAPRWEPAYTDGGRPIRQDCREGQQVR